MQIFSEFLQMSRVIFSLLPLMAFLFGCATAHQPQGMTGGFTETQLNSNVWRVSFRGNGYTRGEKAEDFALLRSAELDLANGFTHFSFSSSRAGTEVSSFTTPITATTSGSANVSGNSVYGSSTTRFSGGNTTYISAPTANNVVVMFKEKPDLIATVFDANFICNSLGKKYEVTCNAPKNKPLSIIENLAGT
jgi:hypothetical protein